MSDSDIQSLSGSVGVLRDQGVDFCYRVLLAHSTPSSLLLNVIKLN